jgi:hypothetical protein
LCFIGHRLTIRLCVLELTACGWDEEALAVRDNAATEWPGWAAALLARRDRLFSENALPSEDDLLRGELCAALRARDRAGAALLWARRRRDSGRGKGDDGVRGPYAVSPPDPGPGST